MQREQNKRTFVGRKLDTTSLRFDTGALAARFLEMLSDGEPFELAGRSRSMGVEAILWCFAAESAEL